MPSGQLEIDFGAFPGKGQASVTLTGQVGFNATAPSMFEAWPMAWADTTDHTVGEQHMDGIRVEVADPVTNVGFTIYAYPYDTTNNRYGKYKVGWAWA
ncbi:MAG TPA: hypothetical protein VFV92_01050 [Candidatus Bathyarchaeia archaeon]|nr:hypothetical protein [Candidatus Bathyarchaeia archaeon]